MPDTTTPLETKIAQAVERMRQVQEAARRAARPESPERRAEEAALPPRQPSR